MLMFCRYLALIGIAVFTACAYPRSKSPQEQQKPSSARPVALDSATSAALEQRLQAFLSQHRIPGIAVAVGMEDRLLWSAQLGVTDLTTAVPVTADSVFPLGSTSKPITALLLGQLVEKGRIDLDAPIQNYVPWFPVKEHVLTARLLASHLAGLRDYNHAAGEYDNTRNFSSVREAVSVFADDPLLFEPGTRHAYSAYNFVLLSAVIEGAAGADFSEVLASRLVQPLGLSSTGLNRAPQPKLVTSYATGPFGRIIPARVGDPSNKWAAGGLVSTPIEMVQLGNAVLAGRVLSQTTFTQLTTPQKLANGSDSGAGYGLGWRSGQRTLPNGRVVPVAHHGGTGPGSMSFFVLYPSEGLALSLQSNLLFSPFTNFAAEAFAIAEAILMARAG